LGRHDFYVGFFTKGGDFPHQFLMIFNFRMMSNF